MTPTHRKALYGLLAVEALLLALHVPARAADAAKIVRMDEESNIPTWFSSSQFLVAGLACAALAAADRTRQLAWTALGGLMLLFSLDEVAELHERVEDHLDADLAVRAIEPLVGLVLLIVLWRGLHTLGRPASIYLVLALCATVGAQAASAISGDTIPDEFFGYAVQALEEVFEMLTGTFVLVAALAARRA